METKLPGGKGRAPVEEEPGEGMAAFIAETIEEFEGAAAVPTTFNEEVLKQPLAVLPPAEALLIESPAPVLEAVQLMSEKHSGCVLVVRGGKLKGILTDRDIVARVVAAGIDPAKTAVRRVMTTNPETLRPTDSIAFALNLMSLGGYRHIPLVDKAGSPVGVVSVKDIVGYLVGFFPKKCDDLPPRPRANYTRQREGA